MKKYAKIAFALVAVAGALSLGSFSSDDTSYETEIKTWQATRTAQLKAPESPLNLAGLFWLEEGANTFGSGTANKIVFPKGKIPAQAGAFVLKNGIVTLQTKADVPILASGKPATTSVIFDDKTTQKLDYGTLRWFVLKSGDKLAIRLYDLQNENQKKFTNVVRYPIDQSWQVKAKFKAHPSATTIDITNIVGQTYPRLVAGTLNFTIKGQEYAFEALEGDELFIVFGDQTNGKGSYPACRFIYTPKPGPDGIVILDFNKAINPNCAFTNYALCPLPPKANRMALAVTAGEKKYSSN